MTDDRYQPPPPVPGALRLHLNEHTGGCSPAVLDAVRRVTTEHAAYYPNYEPLLQDLAAYLGTDASTIAITNGLDEGLLSTVVAAFRPDASSPGIPEAIVVPPAFEMYAIQTRAVGGRVISVPAREHFEFPIDEVLQAVTARTRLVFLTNPNNPTGLLIPRETIRRLARDVPARVTVVLDEAYYEFSGETFLPDLPAHANVVIGRTFAKAHGLAGMRAGCLIGHPERLEPIRNVIPTFNVSVLTAAGWRAALADRAYLAAYQRQVAESKALVYAFCERMKLEYWKSAGNFVLVRTGGDVPALVTRLADRGVLIKDRSSEHGCEGCVRLTAGVVEHTRQALTAMEEILCAAR